MGGSVRFALFPRDRRRHRNSVRLRRNSSSSALLPSVILANPVSSIPPPGSPLLHGLSGLERSTMPSVRFFVALGGLAPAGCRPMAVETGVDYRAQWPLPARVLRISSRAAAPRWRQGGRETVARTGCRSAIFLFIQSIMAGAYGGDGIVGPGGPRPRGPPRRSVHGAPCPIRARRPSRFLCREARPFVPARP